MVASGVDQAEDAREAEEDPQDRIPLNAPAVDLLKKLHQTKRDDVVFSKRHHLNLRRFWIASRDKANLNEPDQALRIHDLRHVFATTALESGQPLAVIASLLGHSSTVMTEHLSDTFLLEASNAVAAKLGRLI